MMMKKILKPHWLLLSAAMPQLFLLAVFYNNYNEIATELRDAEKMRWLVFAVVLGAMLLLLAGYMIYKMIKKRNITALEVITVLIAYISYLYLLLWRFNYRIQFGFTNRMFLDVDPLLIIVGCFMPVLMYCIIALAVIYIPKEGYKPWWNLGAIVALPVFFYLIFLVAEATYFIRRREAEIFENVVVIWLIAATVMFMFLLLRLIYYFYNKKKVSRVIIGAIAGLALPLAGLILNQLTYNVMGDFSSVYFYIAAVLTGTLIMLPDFKNIVLRTIVFFLKSACLTYTLYFFLVFMPFVPLAMVLTIAMGLGFLLLAPSLLLLIHLKSLVSDFKAVKEYFKNKNMAYAAVLIFMTGILIIPSGIAASFIKDRYVINNALEYIYEDGYSETTVIINQASLVKTLENLESAGVQLSSGDIFDGGTPYITGIYNTIVLDNATISEDKIELLRQIYFGTEIKGDESWKVAAQEPAGNKLVVQIKDYYTETIYDEEHGYYKSWLHLEIENISTRTRQYTTNFTLPEGCYISDYYLYVNGEKKMGMITDKRAANWIYQQILTIRRDPGILTYVTDDVVNFKVFPVLTTENRETGIEFVHAEPVVIIFNGIELTFGGEQTISEPLIIGENIEYIPAEVKKGLEPVRREPQYNFIIDCSEKAGDKAEEYIDMAVSFAQMHGLDETKIEYYMTNYNVKKYSGDNEKGKLLTHVEFEGGFFADRAVKMILFDNYINTKETYPVIILITDDMKSSILFNDYEALEYMFPESDNIYFLQGEDGLRKYSLLTGTTGKTTLDGIVRNQESVLIYPEGNDVKAYISKDREGEVLISGIIEDGLFNETNGSKWESGIILEAMNMQLKMRIADRNQTSLQIVQGSIKSRVMTPLSSFIVLETEAQEKALLEMQERILSSDKQYLSDNSSEMTDMSEPSLWLMTAGLAVLAIYKYRKNNKPAINTK